MTVLALDLATVSGWAVGEPGKLLAHGSIRFAAHGAQHEAIFANAHAWIDDKISAYGPALIVWEAPLPGAVRAGKTTINTTAILFGLPAIVGSCAYRRGIFDLRTAYTKDVRRHFINAAAAPARYKR